MIGRAGVYNDSQQMNTMCATVGCALVVLLRLYLEVNLAQKITNAVLHLPKIRTVIGFSCNFVPLGSLDF